MSVIHSIQESIDNRLNSIAEATSFIIQKSEIPISCGSKDFRDMLEAFLGYKDTEGYVRIIDKDKKILSCTAHYFSENFVLDTKDYERLLNGEKFIRTIYGTKENRDKKVRVLFYPLFQQDKYIGYIEVGSSLFRLENMKRSLLHIFLIVIPVVLAVANIGGVIIFNKSFRPIIFLSNEMKNLTVHHLYKRLPEPENDDIITTLYRSINDMIARLQKSFEQIKQFSGDASHELRTPLTIMKGEVELALRTERTKEEYQDILISILEEIDRMINIVENLLLLAKSDAGEILINKKEIDLKDILLELCEQLEMFAEGKKVKLVYDNLKSSIIEGDKLRLRQVFTNLIVNAIKYNVDNGKVIVTLEELKNGVLVVIEDTGIGIKKEELPKIFDRFYRSDKSRKREDGGAGLGLNICKSIIEAHGGYIDVESEVGVGSKFSVWLPKGELPEKEINNG